MHFAPPGWEIHPFCDGYWCLPESEEWPGFFAQDPYGVYAERFGPDLARRFREMTPLPELFRLHLMDVFRRPITPQGVDMTGPAAQSRAFRDAGFVSIHSRIEDPGEDTAVLVRASKFGAVSHQHADQGNFAIISRGKGLISPSGYFGRGGGTRHHREWTLQTRAHNCVLVDGAGQRARAFDTRGRIEFLKDDGVYAVTSLDLGEAYPMLSGFKRRIFMIRPGLVLVYDDLKAVAPVRYSWLAHTLGAPEARADCVAVNRAPASLEIRLFTGGAGAPAFSWTDRFGVDVNDGVPEALHRHHDPQYHLTWVAAGAASRRFVGVMAVNGAAVEVDKTADRLAVSYGACRLEFYLEPSAPDVVSLNGKELDLRL